MSDEVNTPGCGCPICTIGQALDMLGRAHERWIEHGTNEEMNLAYLMDEVRVYLTMPWWSQRKHYLRHALKLVEDNASKSGRVWQHGA